MIRELTLSDIGDSLTLINAVTQKMNSMGINQWDEIYPSYKDIEDDINNKTAFGYIENKKIAAYMSINDRYSSEYDLLKWTVSGKSLIVHRLSVLPAFQGKGIANAMMLFAEDYAYKNKYISIRLDAFLHNPAALALYKKLGYSKIGTVTFRKGIFVCYEKLISQ